MLTIRQLAPLVAALGLVPAAAFLLDRGGLAVGLALVNVLVIAGCLYRLLAPAPDDGRPA